MIAVDIEMTGQEQLQAAFVEMEAIVADFSPIFELLADEVPADIRGRFDAQGPGWPPLAASTVKRKGHTRILRDTDNLYGSFQKGAPGNITRITAKEAEFGSSVPYGVFHQEGTARMPQRIIIEISEAQGARYGRIAMAYLNEKINHLGFQVT